MKSNSRERERLTMHLVGSRFGEAVVDGSQDGLEEGELRVKPKEEEHEEEEYCPEGGKGDSGKSFWIGNEGKTLAPLGNLCNWDTSLLGEESKNREDNAGGDDGGEEIHGADEGCVPVDLVVELVVASKHDEASPGNPEGEEHLAGSIPPDIDLQHLLPFGDEKELDAFHCSIQCEATDQQRDEDQVGEGGGEVNHLPA